MSQYQLQSGLGLLQIKDQETVNFHVQKNDYFGSLATVIKLLQEESLITDQKLLRKTLKQIESDLLYLQKNFKITRIKKTRT